MVRNCFLNIRTCKTGLSDVNYTSTAGQILVWDASNNYWEPADNSNNSDSVSEGSNNKYFTGARVDEVMIAGTGLAESFNSSGGNFGELTLSVNGSNGITTSGDNVVLDYETVSSAPTGVGSTATGHLWFVI